MTTAKSLRVALAALCLMALSCAAPGIASAAEPEKEPIVFLENLPGLSEADGVAFDKANGTVLVASNSGQEHPGEVQIFPGSGGSSVGVLNGAEGSQMTPQGRFEFETFGTIGVAVDGAEDVYVSDTDHHVVDKFAPTGEPKKHEYQYVCQYSGPGRGCMKNPEVELGTPNTFGLTAGLAIDQAGDLYVADFGNGMVDEFDAAAGDVAQIASPAPGCMAVNADGSRLFIQNKTFGGKENEAVELRLGSKGEVLGEAAVAKVACLVFDRESGLLLLQEAGRVAEYDPVENKIVGEVKTASNPEFLERYGGIATQEAGPAGDLYLVEQNGHRLERYGTPTLVAPVLSGESVAEVTSTSVQLHATVQPELRATHYLFQFGVDQSYGGGEVPLAPGGVVPGAQSIALVSAQLEALQPGGTYHYRIVATNRAGSTFGPDRTFTTFPLEALGLPDNRIWEMVSPLDKNGGPVAENVGREAVQASADGEKLTYEGNNAFGDAQGNLSANQYVASRGAGEWVTQNITPPARSGAYGVFPEPYKAFSSDLGQGVLRNGEGIVAPPRVDLPLPGTGAPPFYDDYYVRENESGAYRSLLTSPPEGYTDATLIMQLEGVTPDLGHMVVAFIPSNGLEPKTLEEWSPASGVLSVVNVAVNPLVAGEEVADSILGSGNDEATHGGPHAISADGSRVFWSVGVASEPVVFVRENPAAPESPRGGGGACLVAADACTLQLPAGEFVDASTNGSKVLLSTGEVFDVDRMRKLANITAGAGGFVGELGASEDLSTVYFVDSAVLPGASANSLGGTPQPGEDNLYVYREGASPRFIGTLESTDATDWTNGTSGREDVSVARTTRVTPDGGTLLLDSSASLTGYDNRTVASGAAADEVFVYHAATGALVCASCNPTGEPPVTGARILAGNRVEGLGTRIRGYYQPRVLSSDGERVFFDSSEALVAGDSNGAQDVYEYQDGRARLISGGTGAAASLVDASETGGDVFFTTENQLVPGDTDSLVDVYDARVDGGFPAPASEPACTGTGCQGVPAQPPIFATPSSGTFNGIGNFPAALAAPAPTKTAAQLRAEKLKKALKACKKAHPRSKRLACEKTAHRKYNAARHRHV